MEEVLLPKTWSGVVVAAAFCSAWLRGSRKFSPKYTTTAVITTMMPTRVKVIAKSPNALVFPAVVDRLPGTPQNRVRGTVRMAGLFAQQTDFTEIKV